MKKLYILLLVAAGFVAIESCQHNRHSIKVSVSESDNTFTFSAVFPIGKTNAVHRVVNNNLSPAGLFSSENDHLNVTTSFQDNGQFSVKAEPGLIRVTMDRQGNSPASYARVKNMCNEIKLALKDE